MNKLKIIISYILIILMIPLNVKASGSSGSIDVGFSLDGTYGDGGQYEAYTYKPDDSNLPSGFHYYYKFSDGHVGTYSRDEVVGDILGHKIGIVMSPTRLATFISGYSSWLSQDPNYYNVLKPVLKNGSIVGVALNGLTGGTIASASPSGNVSIPSTEVNNVYNYYNIWIATDGFIAPDYINIQGESKSYFVNRVNANLTQANRESIINTLNNCTVGFSLSSYASLQYTKTTNVVDQTNVNTTCMMLSLQDGTCLTGLTNNLCVALGLDANNDTITWAQLLTKDFNGESLRCYNKETYETVKFNIAKDSGVTQSNSASLAFKGGNSSNIGLFIGNITLYRDVNVVQAIKNNTYNAPEYKTNNYNNYNVNNNNTYEAPSSQIQNSITDNSNVYNQANTSNNTNIKNQIDNSDNSYSYVDNSQIITNTTTIVNNYYQNNYGSGGGDNDNPDNPDNPSGGGGGLEDDSILDALLAAILKLLRAIGKIIATILTGIIDIITEVLTAITNITTSFTGIIEFIGSIFGFLPAECVAVLTLGLTISVLIALIKMFGK